MVIEKQQTKFLLKPGFFALGSVKFFHGDDWDLGLGKTFLSNSGSSVALSSYRN